MSPTRPYLGLSLLIVAAAIATVATRLPSPTAQPLVEALPALQIDGTNSVDAKPSAVVARGGDPYLVLHPPPQPVRAVRLDYVPRHEGMRQDFYIYYAPVDAGAFSQEFVGHPRIKRMADRWRLEWTLPVPARALRLDVPDDADFTVVGWETAEKPFEPVAPRSRAATIGFVVAIVLALFGFHAGWASRDVVTLRSAVALTLIVPGTIVLFLLPPFQGPDEGGHWELALAMTRPGVVDEQTAFLLPDVLRVEPIRFHPERKFDPGRFGAVPEPPQPAPALAAWIKVLHDNYPYARPYGYPFVTAVSLFFPHVVDTDQAVTFFYLSRLLGALTCAALLGWAVRRQQLSAVALAFFSLPLVLQQAVIVSADNLLNTGALAAALLYLHLEERASLRGLIALWLLVLAIVGVKFVYAPLLLLPMAAMPLSLRRRTAIAAGIVGLLAAYPAVLVIGHQVRNMAVVMGRPSEAAAQVASMATVAGWKALGDVYLRYMATLPHAVAWSGPLGWLDTALGETHLTLIRLTALVAVVADLCLILPAWRAFDAARRRSVAVTAAVAIAAMIFVTLFDVLLYFLMATNPGTRDVAGVQVRHFFPIVIAAVVILSRRLAAPETERPHAGRTFAWTILGSLMLARSILLAQDLLVRYW